MKKNNTYQEKKILITFFRDLKKIYIQFFFTKIILKNANFHPPDVGWRERLEDGAATGSHSYRGCSAYQSQGSRGRET